MKGFGFALLVLTALEASSSVSAFAPCSLRKHAVKPVSATSVDMATESDVSIPYDAAARLTYDEWCKTNGKSFDAAKYATFKDNYEAITVMNVSAKKKARESGEEAPSLLALNEYADCTAAEYQAIMNGEEPPSSTGDVLGKAVEAAESQAAASSALQEAADALAEEEEVGLTEFWCCGDATCLLNF